MPPEAQARAIKALAEALQRMRDEILPQMEALNKAFKAAQTGVRSAHYCPPVMDIRVPGANVPPVPHADPRQQALAARRNRNTGPSHHPYKHRGNR